MQISREKKYGEFRFFCIGYIVLHHGPPEYESHASEPTHPIFFVCEIIT